MKKLAPILGLLAALAAIPAAAQTQFPTTLPASSVWGRTGIGAGPGQAIPFSILGANLFLGFPAHGVILAEGGGNPLVGVSPGAAGLPFISNGASADPSYQQLTGVAMPALTGDVTSTAGTVATTIGTNVVTNAKAAQAAANTMKGNWTGVLANVADNTMPSCADTGGNHLNYVSGTGITCGNTANIAGLGSITVQRFTSGTSLTYTPTGGIVRAHIRIVGGGGGGGATSTNNGTAGGTTSFGSWTAVGGGAGLAAQIAATGAGPSGGSGGTNGTGTLVARFGGQNGGMPFNLGSGIVAGSVGGQSIFGGGTNTIGVASTTGITPQANTGSGGSGGETSGTNGGSGGGAGEYAEFWMTSAQIGASQTYTVGAGGNGGVAGGNAGGAGAAGIIIVEEYPF